MNVHTFSSTVLVGSIFVAVCYADTNQMDGIPTQLQRAAALAQTITGVPGLAIRSARVWEGGWPLLSADVVAKIDHKGHRPINTGTTEFVHVNAYYQEFALPESCQGYIKCGSFTCVDEAHSAFLYATTTTALPWYPNEEHAKQLTPEPDEVLFGNGESLIFRHGTTCVHVHVCGAEEETCIKQVIEIANRILAQIASTERSE